MGSPRAQFLGHSYPIHQWFCKFHQYSSHTSNFCWRYNLFTSHRNLPTLQDTANTELIKVDAWFKHSLSVSKTNCMLFRSNRKKINTELFHINIDGQEIIRVNSQNWWICQLWIPDRWSDKEFIKICWSILQAQTFSFIICFTYYVQNPFRTSSELL